MVFDEYVNKKYKEYMTPKIIDKSKEAKSIVKENI